MMLDVSLLRRASVPNLERLARSLGVTVPGGERAYWVRLVDAIATKVRQDAMLDELAKLRGRAAPNVVDVIRAEIERRKVA